MKRIKLIEHCFFLIAISLLFYKKALVTIEDPGVASVEITKEDNNKNQPTGNKQLKQTAALIHIKKGKKKP